MASILDLVQHYQHSIEKHPNDEQKVLKCIDKLYQLGVTVQHLQETGVGRTVNALRKEPGDVGTAARALVNKWKLMVANEENSEPEDHNHDTTNCNGHGHGKDSSDDSMNQCRDGGATRDHKSSRSSQRNDHRHINGNHGDTKRKYHSSEDSEPDTKKSRKYQSPDNDENDSKPNVKVKSEPSGTESDENSGSHSESETSDSSDEDARVKNKIKTEPQEKHKSSSSKHSSRVETKKERKDSSPKKSHDEKHSKHKESRHSSEKSSSSKDRSSSSHKRSKEKENSSERKQRSQSKSSSDKEKGSSNRHSSSDRHRSSSNKESGSNKHKNPSEKHESKPDKHRSSSQSDKEKLKSPSERETKEKHRSKDKTSSSDKEKSRDRSSSSKEKSSHSHSKSEKKHSSSSDKSKSKEKSSETRNVDKESRHGSSSSHKIVKSSSSSKIKDGAPKKKKSQENSEESEEGIDCGSGGLSFAEALGMVSPAKPKKKNFTKDTSSPINSFENNIHNDFGPATLLAPTAKLAPLPPLEISALPEISPNYKPRPPPKLLPQLFTDEDAMSQVISIKNQRTKVFSGNKTYGKVPSLYELCVNVLQEHIEALEYTGGVPYEILKPVVDRATPQQLFMLEHFNPYLMEDTDHLWQKFCEKSFRNKKRQEMETWREMYMRCQEEQECKLRSLTANIKMTQEAKKAPIKQTKMAYVDTVVKPPRNIARKQALHGTARSASASPAARVAALATASNVLRAGVARPPPSAPALATSSASFKPKKAPLMAKALQFMRGKRR